MRKSRITYKYTISNTTGRLTVNCKLTPTKSLLNY